MKKIIVALIFISAFLSGTIHAQSLANNLPEAAVVIPYKLQVGYNTTTVLIFPVSVINGDRGYNEIVIQKEKAVENILKVKAAKRNFLPTNLHVYTTDGKVYSFNVEYIDCPRHTTFDLNKLRSNETEITPLILPNTTVSNLELKERAEQVRQSKHFFSKKNMRYGMKLQLLTIHNVNNVVFFGFSIANQSNLNYDVDFIRLYIKDRKKAKRSSVQEQEIIPVYSDSFQQVAGEKENKYIVAIPQFTIPDNKEFIIEMYEKNGGRNISMKIKNKFLLKARSL